MLQLESLVEGGEQVDPTTKKGEIKITQSIFPKHLFGWKLKITSSGLMFNYWLSIRKGSFSGVSAAFNGETHTWKIMQNVTWDILASLRNSRFDMKCPAQGRWVHHGSNLSLPLQLVHTLAQVSGEWFSKFPFLSHTDFSTVAEHMETWSLSFEHPPPQQQHQGSHTDTPGFVFGGPWQETALTTQKENISHPATITAKKSLP